MNTPAMTEEQMVFLVRNALLVAGQEMGNGDEWPVVKDTVYKIMQDWEDVKTERAVDAELKIHTYEQLRKMEEALDHYSPDMQDKLTPLVAELRDVADAYFTDTNSDLVEIEDENVPMHIQRMNAILGTLEE